MQFANSTARAAEKSVFRRRFAADARREKAVQVLRGKGSGYCCVVVEYPLGGVREYEL